MPRHTAPEQSRKSRTRKYRKTRGQKRESYYAKKNREKQ